METLSPIGIMRRKNIMGSFDIDLDQGTDFKNNHIIKQFYLDQYEASKDLFLPSYWSK